jgi:hypothetical protein
MNAPAYDAGSMGLMLNELRLPTIGRLIANAPIRKQQDAGACAGLKS